MRRSARRPQYTDPETGLQYLRARYYDPATGQFLTSDPAVGATRDAYGYATRSPLVSSDPSGLTTTKCDFQFGEHAFGCLHIEGTGEYVSSITFHYFDLREPCPYFSSTDFVVARVSIETPWEPARKVDYGTYYVTEGQAISQDTHESGYFANGTEVCVQFFYRKETTSKRQKTGPGDPITDNICATIHR